MKETQFKNELANLTFYIFLKKKIMVLKNQAPIHVVINVSCDMMTQV